MVDGNVFQVHSMAMGRRMLQPALIFPEADNCPMRVRSSPNDIGKPGQVDEDCQLVRVPRIKLIVQAAGKGDADEIASEKRCDNSCIVT